MSRILIRKKHLHRVDRMIKVSNLFNNLGNAKYTTVARLTSTLRFFRNTVNDLTKEILPVLCRFEFTKDFVFNIIIRYNVYIVIRVHHI